MSAPCSSGSSCSQCRQRRAVLVSSSTAGGSEYNQLSPTGCAARKRPSSTVSPARYLLRDGSFDASAVSRPGSWSQARPRPVLVPHFILQHSPPHLSTTLSANAARRSPCARNCTSLARARRHCRLSPPAVPGCVSVTGLLRSLPAPLDLPASPLLLARPPAAAATPSSHAVASVQHGRHEPRIHPAEDSGRTA